MRRATPAATWSSVSTAAPRRSAHRPARFFDLNRWYHVEVRVTGSRLPRLHRRRAGARRDRRCAALERRQIGFYANNQSDAYFDDVLVTRLDETGCTVGAGDPVTYTLTISNQGQVAGHELVITDAIPSGRASTPTPLPARCRRRLTGEPTTIPGATDIPDLDRQSAGGHRSLCHQRTLGDHADRRPAMSRRSMPAAACSPTRHR